jgi:hypothetical protein
MGHPNTVRHADCQTIGYLKASRLAGGFSAKLQLAHWGKSAHAHQGRLSRPHNPEIQEQDLLGFRHFKPLVPVLEKLHHDAYESDQVGDHKLHYDQCAALMLLCFFNPIVTVLRGMPQASELEKAQHKLGCSRASLGSLSEAARVFGRVACFTLA